MRNWFTAVNKRLLEALQAAETPSEDPEGSKRRSRRGAGLAARRTESTLTSLEMVFTSLRLLDKHDAFSGSIMIMLGSSLSKPREAIEIVFPSQPTSCPATGESDSWLSSACIQATRQLMPLTSQMPAPATGKAKMFVAVSSQCSLPAAQFNTIAEHRCSLKRCLASVVHVQGHSASQQPQPPSWLMQHADHSGSAAVQMQEIEQEQGIVMAPAPLQVCSTAVAGLTCSSGLSR